MRQTAGWSVGPLGLRVSDRETRRSDRDSWRNRTLSVGPHNGRPSCALRATRPRLTWWRYEMSDPMCCKSTTGGVNLPGWWILKTGPERPLKPQLQHRIRAPPVSYSLVAPTSLSPSGLTYGSVPEDGDFTGFRLRHISFWLSHLVLGVNRNLQPEWHPKIQRARRFDIQPPDDDRNPSSLLRSRGFHVRGSEIKCLFQVM